MGWKDRFREGSFRGVAFLIEGADSDFGRRLVAHEFPQQEKPFLEDLGRKARKFTLECYVLGDDYLTQRDTLLSALEKPGPGPLLHPYYGRVTVHVEGVKVRDSSSEARLARFQISFVETGTSSFPQGRADTVAAVKAASLGARERMKAAFVRVYHFSTLPYAHTQDVLRAAQAASDQIRKAQGAVNGVAAFAKNVQDIGGSLSQIILDGELLADSFLDLIGFGFLDEDQNQDAIPDLRQSFTGLVGLYAFAPALAAPSSASEALGTLIQLAALNTTVTISSQIAFSSQDEGYAFRDLMLAKIDALALGELDDDLFDALTELRTVVEEDISLRAGLLARLIPFETPNPIPALVISNLLYGDLSQEQDILDRNHIVHPGFVSGRGIPIQVLSNV